MNRLALCALACTLSLVSSALSPAHAQTVGTFRWQLQPYCNVITTTITQSGGVYTVDGTDDLCGANPRAAVTGLAFLNANGTVSFGLSLVVPPSPTAIQLTATIDLGSLGGTWQDSAGNTGAFVFSPAAVSGSPRPAATPVFTAGLSAGGGRINNVGAPTASTDAANRGYVDSAVAAATAGLHVVGLASNGWQLFDSTDNVRVVRYSNGVYFRKAAAGSSFITLPVTTPVSLYGKSLQLLAFEFCYTASASARLTYFELNSESSDTGPNSSTRLATGTTVLTDSTCRYQTLTTPRTLTANDALNLYLEVDWTVPSDFILGRTSFVFAPTSTPLTPPSDVAPPPPPAGVTVTGPATAAPRP